MIKKVLILGGEGNGTIIANAILDANMRGFNDYVCCGLLNDGYPVGTVIDSFEVLGGIKNDFKKFLDEGYYFINAILRIDGNDQRIQMIEDLHIPEDRLVTFVHPTAYVAPNVRLSPGCVIMPLVTMSSNTILGKCCIVLNSANIGHDDIIGDYCHISSHACVGSFLSIGRGVHVGLNATIREHLKIGDFATVGMGAVLTHNVGNGEIWVGNPARFLRMVE